MIRAFKTLMGNADLGLHEARAKGACGRILKMATEPQSKTLKGLPLTSGGRITFRKDGKKRLKGKEKETVENKKF